MTNRHVLCIAIDRLRASAVGCYGAAWSPTPALDRLACESLVFDQAYIDSPCLESLYRSLWQGSHAMTPAETLQDRPSLPVLMGTTGVHSTLITDDPNVANHPLAGGFGDRVVLDVEDTKDPVDSVEETRFARLSSLAIDTLDGLRQAGQGSTCVWLHARGLNAPWDAPLEYRNQLADEEDPLPPQTAVVPNRRLDSSFDPDEVLGVAQAYFGQVAAIDTCLAVLMEYLAESGWLDSTLVVVLGVRGFALGEHLEIGSCGDGLYSELLHIPLFLRFPDGRAALARSDALVQSGDVAATIADWFEIRPFGDESVGSLLSYDEVENPSGRDRLCMTSGADQRAIRTPLWFFRRSTGSQDSRGELFVKPDDRWEANEVADRCPEIAARLNQAIEAFETAQRDGAADTLSPLDAALIAPIE